MEVPDFIIFSLLPPLDSYRHINSLILFLTFKCASNCTSCNGSCTGSCNSGCTGSCASCTGCLVCTGHCNSCTLCHMCTGSFSCEGRFTCPEGYSFPCIPFYSPSLCPDCVNSCNLCNDTFDFCFPCISNVGESCLYIHCTAGNGVVCRPTF